jgi:hypothetical protein
MRLRGFLPVVAVLSVLASPSAALAEEGCVNEAVRQAEAVAHPEGFALGLPDCRAFEQVTPVDKDGTNPGGYVDGVQASPSGDGIVFVVPANMPGAGGATRIPVFFMGGRSEEGWSDRGLEMPSQPQGTNEVVGWSEDLSEVIQEVHVDPSSVSGRAVYLRDSSTGVFQLGFSAPGFGVVSPVGFSADDSRSIFETSAQLLPGAAMGRVNLYELHGGVVSLAGVLPDGSTPPGGSFAGPYFAFPLARPGERDEESYKEHTISSDGSRVFFTAGGTEQIYVREDGTRTVPVGTGAFLAATPDGSQVFYLAGGAGGDLVEFDVESEQATDLTPGGGVEGLLGVSDDGAYVYFAVNGGGLYVWHGGTTSFVATSSERLNWTTTERGEGHATPKVSRVSSDGRFLLFTGSDGQLDRYDAVHGRLACVSCAPSGAPLTGPAALRSILLTSPSIHEPAILVRNLSSDGGRVFFESPDALLPRDTNGVQDVYEWEQQGLGGCQGSSESFSSASGGCLYLISSGTSLDPSFFADASANGDSVFFYTDQPLVGQDQDGGVDIYDARVGGGFAGQNPPAPPVACEGEGCMPGASGAPVFAAPVSATFTGAGNQTPAPAVTAPKPKPKAKHKAVKPKRKKKRRARKAGRGAHGAGVRGAMRGGK